jgi:hypothetical protein
MNPRLFLVGMVTAASAPMFAACAGTEFVLTGADASSSDAGTDVALFDEPLIVKLDATSADREARAETGADRSACDPTKSPHDDPCVIDDALGAFVAPIANGGSDTTGSGTKASPYATIGHAVASAAHRSRIYVCDAIYTEQVTLFSTMSMYGGLSCPGGDAGAEWAYVGGLAVVVSPSGDPAFTLNAVAPAISVEDMGFTASNASGQDATGNGKSSIAAFVKASAVDFRRCTFRAGSGDTGGNGTTGTNYTADAATAPNGQPPDDAGGGGPGGSVRCRDGTSSQGGTGGNGATPSGTNGGDGGAMPLPPAGPGQDGRGGPGGMFSCGGTARPGANGVGEAGAGSAAVANFGSLVAQGWIPARGGDGSNGGPGQGGGGGGGSGTPLVGGTGGGAGGCGGAGGSGGNGGGASIALACMASNLTLDACTLATANGGNGGKGAGGQAGQGGGTYGSAVGPCLGGYGGNGAGGGGGAGGTGGVSIDIVYQGTAPTGMRLYSTGNGGQPGTGGMGSPGGTNPIGTGAAGPSGAAGLAGLATSIWQMQ